MYVAVKVKCWQFDTTPQRVDRGEQQWVESPADVGERVAEVAVVTHERPVKELLVTEHRAHVCRAVRT